MNPLNHVAIIMDGNGRWGLKYKSSRNDGHKAGLKTVEKIIKEFFLRYLLVKNFEKRLLASKQIIKPMIKIDIIKTFL